MLDVPFQLAVFVPELLAEHRREIGTRALGCWKQAVFALACGSSCGHLRIQEREFLRDH